MLRMCRTIFGSGKAVVLDSGFFVDKGITELEANNVNGQEPCCKTPSGLTMVKENAAP